MSLFDGVCVAYLFSFLVLSYYGSLCSEFRDVMSVTISALKRCLVRLYLQLFVGGLMLYLRYMCVFAHSGVQHTLCWFCLVLFCFLFFFLRLDMLPVSMDCLFVVAP